MTDFIDEVMKALRMLTKVNPLITVMLWVLWSMTLRGSWSFTPIPIVLMTIYTVLIAIFEYIRLSE